MKNFFVTLFSHFGLTTTIKKNKLYNLNFELDKKSSTSNRTKFFEVVDEMAFAFVLLKSRTRNDVFIFSSFRFHNTPSSLQEKESES